MSSTSSACLVCYCDSSQRTVAIALAEVLAMPYADYNDPIRATYSYILYYQHAKLFLSCQQQPHLKPFTVDFTQGRLAHRLQHDINTRQPLARAVGIKPHYRPTILDISAGFAQDASILAKLGCTITLLERNPIVWALLNDGLIRARGNQADWSMRMTLHHQAANLYLQHHHATCPDVIYYDPMFPATSKHAKVQKPMQILQALVKNDDHADQDVFHTARKSAAKRVVVKRPNYAEPLFDVKPDLQIAMLKYRFDVYLTRAVKDE